MAVEIAVSVLAKIAEYLVLPCGRQFGYLFCYNRNIKNLINEAEKLNKKTEGVHGDVAVALRNCEDIKPEVEDWLKRADAMKIIEDNEKVGKRCLNGWCPNIKSRYSLSKKALKKTQNLGELIAEGKFDKVANPPTPVGIIRTAPAAVETPVDVKFRGDGIQEASEAAPVIDLAMPSTSQGGFGGFESRSWIMRDVMKALKDDKVRIIGIWGMGGVGKTTMVNEIEETVKNEHIFEAIGKAVVSQQPDLKNVQDSIAEMLGPRLQEQSLSARAARLHERLTQKGRSNKPEKILIVLDDIWKRLDLEEVGIRFANDPTNCKILFTSREKDVCDQMSADKTFRIEVLVKEEACSLFQEKARITPGATDLFPIEDIVNECGGLPLAITTIASALANKSRPAWKNALRQLKGSALEGPYAVVYTTFQVSYDFLQTKEIKDCFLLCCLFQEDFDIPIEDLVRNGAGLEMFRNINRLHEARENAHAHVEMLRNSNLLLESTVVDCAKMHDLVRDFGLKIASEGKFLVKFGNEIKEWPSQNTYEHYTSISLQCDEMDELPDGLECPNLKLLQLVIGLDHDSLKFPERFFEGMRKLQVLILRRMSVPSLPGSLEFLANLRTLSLNHCILEGDVSMIGKLEVLEILSFAHSEIQDLPTQIGKLSRLRLLDLTSCSELHRIPPGLLSSLTHLEELYLRGTFIRWAEEIQANPSIHGDGGREMNASFAELKVLSNLVVLEIDIPYEVLPLVDLIFLEKLEKFYVCFGGTHEKEMMHAFQNTLCCIVDKSIVPEGVFQVMCKKTEVLYLKVKDLKNLQKEFEREELLKVRDLELVSCDEMVSLINTVGRQTTNVFRNLESLCLSDMCKLKSIFSLSIASGLIKLKRLKVVRCQAMEELFTKERGGEAAGTFEFPHLQSLHLNDLPSLVGFCKAVVEIELPQLEEMELWRLPKITSIYSKTEDLAAERQNASSEHSFFNGKVKLNNMARLQLEGMENLTEILLPHNLRALSVYNCGRLVNISLSAIASGLVMLERLIIHTCEMMDAIFWKERGEDEAAATAVAKIQFPHLKDLFLMDLPNLAHFCKSFEEVELPQLEGVNLVRLPKLDGLASKGRLFNTKGLQNLRWLEVNKCDWVEVVFDLQRSNVNEGGHELQALSTQLQRVELWNLDNLRHVWKKGPHVIQGSSFQNLSYLEVYKCGSLRHVFTPSIAKVLVGLQSVYIYNCENLEAIVAKEEEGEEEKGGGMMLFPQLTTLSLRRLPKLLNMTPNPYTINWSSLEKLTFHNCGKLIETMNGTLQGLQNLDWLDVRDCELVEVVFDLQRSNVNEGGHELAALSTQLTSVQLWNLDNLRHVWKKGPHVIQGSSFQNLSYLNVGGCGSLRHVFTPSVAKVLVGLQEVRISSCMNLEAIVAKEEEGEEEEEGGGMMLFPQLTTLYLRDLPKLLNMTPKPYTINWSSLKELTLDNCGKLIEKLNDTLQVALVNMETLKVHKLDNVTVFFPTSVLPQLEHLEQLDIRSCCSLEVVFDLQGLNANNEGRNELLASLVTQLTEIDLYGLPKLRHIWKTGAHVIQGSFKYLTSLHVEHCDSLKHVFTPSMAKLLLELEKVEIVECKNLEAIVAKEYKEEECRLELGRGGGITVNLFPQLTSLHLRGLRNLMTITPKPYTFDRSILEVIDCDKLQDIQ